MWRWGVLTEGLDNIGFNAQMNYALSRGVLGLVFGLYLSQWMSAALVVFANHAINQGEALSLTEAYRRGRPYIWRLVGISLLAVLIVAAVALVGALIGLITPMAIFLVAIPVALVVIWFILAPYAAVSENLSVTESFRRSRQLVSRRFWTVVGYFLLILVVAFIGYFTVSFVLGILTGVLSFALPSSAFGTQFGTVQAIIQLFVGLISPFATGFFAACYSVLYWQLRIYHEGIDLKAEAEAILGQSGTEM